MDDTASKEPAIAGNEPPIEVFSHADPVKESAPVAKASKTSPTETTSLLQVLADKVLFFLSHASNETLVACLAGLGVATYFVLGRIGLFVIGLAGGVVLQATWEGLRRDTRDEETKRLDLERKREVGIEVARRLLEWRAKNGADLRAEDVKIFANQALNFSEFGPETEEALNAFTEAIIKDYVHYWYDPTIPGEESFPASCRRTLTAFLLSLSAHLNRKRAADAFLDFVTNSSSIIIVFLTELAAALNASPNTTAEEAISTYLSLKPDSSLSYMLNPDSQATKLADASEEILQAYLDPKAYNCPPVHVFLREVLAQLVLGYTVTLCSRPEWINDWIVYGLEESETTKGVMQIVDAGVEGKALPTVAETPVDPPQESRPKQEPAKSAEMAPGHRRTRSKAEISMEEAMEEARRLTALMIAEDERRAKEEKDQFENATSGEASPEVATQGLPTPTSSQSDLGKQDEQDSAAESPTSVKDSPARQQFTNFEQLLPTAQPTALSEPIEKAAEQAEKPVREPIILTLHNARISIFDDSMPGERASIKAKPTTDYLIQIEPAATGLPGWMIARKYADFETLHEILRRISVITGVNFAHAELPKWRNNTKISLRTELEKYLCDAVRLQPLAESEGMKRFLDKDRGLTRSPGGAKGFGWPTPDAFGKIGGDMMNVLTKAPKQVAGGGKAMLGGVAGLVTSGKKVNSSQTQLTRTTTGSSVDKPHGGAPRDRSSIGGPFLTDSYLGSVPTRDSQDSLRAPSLQEMARRGSAATTTSEDSKVVTPGTPKRPRSFIAHSQNGFMAENSPSSSIVNLPGSELSLEATLNLPPPPSEMPEDYTSPIASNKRSIDLARSTLADPSSKDNTGSGTKPFAASASRQDPSHSPNTSPPKPKEPLTEREAAVAIELMFAVITQLYTLSSAWNIRRTLLTAAKTFLLRPGNPQLLGIKDLLQKSLIDANLSDEGLAHQIIGLRKNALPTAEELEIWNRDYPEKTPAQKEELRIKARRLLVSRGMPQALTSVMGAAASGEALGKVFDSLQVERVSRGLIFGLVLQALRVLTH